MGRGYSYLGLVEGVIENSEDIGFTIEYIVNTFNDLVGMKDFTGYESNCLKEVLGVIEEARTEEEEIYAINYAKNTITEILPVKGTGKITSISVPIANGTLSAEGMGKVSHVSVPSVNGEKAGVNELSIGVKLNDYRMLRTENVTMVKPRDDYYTGFNVGDDVLVEKYLTSNRNGFTVSFDIKLLDLENKRGMGNL